MSRAALAFASVRGPEDRHWPGFTAVYREAFAAVEREPEGLLAARTRAGRYRLRVAVDDGGAVAGCYVVDVVPSPGYALLCYLAVQRRWRRYGLGRRLCQDAVTWFRDQGPASLLLVEALPRAARLYRRCGFARLALDYRVPNIDAPGVQPMALLALPLAGQPESIDGARLRGIVRHLFVDGYLVAENDGRLQAQLARIPEHTRMEHAPIPAAG